MYIFVKYNKFTWPWTETMVLISTWIVKTSTVLSIQTEYYPISFVGDGRSMQMILISQNAINRTDKYSTINQINSSHLHFSALNHHRSTPGIALLFWFREIWCFRGKVCHPFAKHPTRRTSSQCSWNRRKGDPYTSIPLDTGQLGTPGAPLPLPTVSVSPWGQLVVLLVGIIVLRIKWDRRPQIDMVRLGG